MTVLALCDGSARPCLRFFESLGAHILPATPETLARLATDADLLVETARPGALKALGLDYAALAARNPRLIQVSLTPFGQDGPYAGYAGSELVCSALGGVLLTVGYEDRPPVKEALDACLFHANGYAACAAMIALYERQISGLGQHVDVSVQEVAASRNTNGLLLHQFDGRALKRSGDAISYGNFKVRCIWPLADGYAFHSLMSGRFGAPANAALSRWLDESGVENPLREVDWSRYDRANLPPETRAVWEQAIGLFFRSKTKAEIADEGRRRGINATVLNEPADVLADPHLMARQFFDGTGMPRRFVAVSGGAQAAPAPAPKPSGAGPLAGLRVLDFSWALVGSITTKQLADCGATVIKVESATRPCLSRIDVQARVSRRDSFDDKPWFIHMNTSKRSLRINMKHARAREVIDPLLAWADVVVENFSPGTMTSLGLDYATLAARHPGLVMLSGSVYGQTGPWAREWGVDGTGAALSSRAFLTGWPDRPPVIPASVPYGDVVQPPYMVGALCAVLAARRQTGQGAHIDASMYEVCAQQMWDALAAAKDGAVPARSGNGDSRVLHQGVYPAAGEDSWVVVTVTDKEAWKRLAALTGGPAHFDPTAADQAITAFTSRLDRHGAMRQLQEAGIAAGAVQTAADLLERDPQLRHRGFVQMLDNPVLGAFEHQSTPYKFSRTPQVMRTAPNLGGHTEEICRDIAGILAERFAALVAEDLFQ